MKRKHWDKIVFDLCMQDLLEGYIDIDAYLSRIDLLNKYLDGKIFLGEMNRLW